MERFEIKNIMRHFSRPGCRLAGFSPVILCFNCVHIILTSKDFLISLFRSSVITNDSTLI